LFPLISRPTALLSVGRDGRYTAGDPTPAGRGRGRRLLEVQNLLQFREHLGALALVHFADVRHYFNEKFIFDRESIV
jgi:hypothetical protein